MKLEIEMIPGTSFGNNLRKMMKKSQWDKIRKMVYEKCNNCCAICGAKKGVDCDILNAHEVWEFNDDTKTQKLANIIAVCNNCHNCIHYGRTTRVAIEEINFGLIIKTIKHYIKVNNCSLIHFLADKNYATHIWQKRSSHKWKLDISYLKDIGFEEVYNSIYSNKN